MPSARVVFQQHPAAPACMHLLSETLAGVGPGLEGVGFADWRQAMAALAERDIAVLVVCVISRQDLIGAVSLLRTQSSRVRDGAVRVLALCGIEHERVPLILESEGCAEVLSLQMSRASLASRIHVNLQSAEQAFKRRAAAERGALPGHLPASARVVRWENALELAADCWLLRKRGVRIVDGAWLIEAMGPGPAVGSWEEIAPDRWQWKPNAEHAQDFGGAGGVWLWSGHRPEYDSRTRRYRLVSAQPRFYFRQLAPPGHPSAEWNRIRWEAPNRLVITANSEVARAKRDRIEESYGAAGAARWTGQDRPLAGHGQVFGAAALTSIAVVARVGGKDARLLEWDSSGIVLDALGESFAEGETCDVFIRSDEPPAELKRRLRVAAAEAVEVGRWVVRFTLSERAAMELEELSAVYLRRQGEVGRFIREIKGL